jgi:hypothetical protein
MKDELTTILEAMRAAQGELADYLVSADRNAEPDDRQAGGHSRTPGGRQGHAVGPRLPKRAATNASRGELMGLARPTLCETNVVFCDAA